MICIKNIIKKMKISLIYYSNIRILRVKLFNIENKRLFVLKKVLNILQKIKIFVK